MPINRRSNLDPDAFKNPLGTFFKKMSELDGKMQQARIDSVKDIANQRLSQIISPQNFISKYDAMQREQILRDQFLNKAKASELKPYLIADREYLVSHFRNKDIRSDQMADSKDSIDEIPNDYYFDYEEIEKKMRFPIEFIKNEEVESVLGEINSDVLSELHTLDFYRCVCMTDLTPLSNFQFNHLHEINCSNMNSLETLDGLPRCRYRELNLKECGSLKSLDALENISIKKLNLSNCTSLTDLTPLLQIKDLEIINLTKCQKAKPTPTNIEVLETLKSRGVKLHAEMHTMLPWMKHKHLFEETKKLDISDHFKGLSP